MSCIFFFFFKQKTAYEITYGDWSSDVCSSDLSDAAMARQRGDARSIHCRRHAVAVVQRRSEERRVGKECRRLCRSLWSPSHEKKKKDTRHTGEQTVYKRDDGSKLKPP